jgi:hypothetical protein
VHADDGLNFKFVSQYKSSDEMADELRKIHALWKDKDMTEEYNPKVHGPVFWSTPLFGVPKKGLDLKPLRNPDGTLLKVRPVWAVDQTLNKALITIDTTPLPGPW